MARQTAGPRRTDSPGRHVRATRMIGALSVLVLCGAIAWDLADDGFWVRHTLFTSLIASLIVVAVTAAVLNEVLERRQRERWSVLYNGIGRYDAGRDAARQVIDHDVIGYGPLAIGELAEAASRTGDDVLLRRALEWICERTAVVPNHWSTGIETRIRAFLSDGDDADELYQDSIARLSKTRRKTEVGRGHLLYGEWLRRAGRRAEAREQLAIAHDLLLSMGLDGFARRAAHELQATGATPRERNPTTRDQLTPQERRIARLASAGLSNREIGQQLFISHRTVGYHLAKVFAKLGVNNRALIHEDMLGDGPDG